MQDSAHFFILAPDDRILHQPLYTLTVIEILPQDGRKTKMQTNIIARISEKVSTVGDRVLVECVHIGTDMGQGDGFTHYFVVARAPNGLYNTWRAIDRRENGKSEIVLASGNYDFPDRASAQRDMYDRANSAIYNFGWGFPEESL